MQGGFVWVKANSSNRVSCEGQITLFDLLETQPDISVLDVQLNISSMDDQPNISGNHILCRKNVYYCIKNRSKFNSNKYKFDNKCEVTGEQWEADVWISEEYYEKHPTKSPCKTCGHVKCEWCAFNTRGEKPHGCCGSCTHKDYCDESHAKRTKI